VSVDSLDGGLVFVEDRTAEQVAGLFGGCLSDQVPVGEARSNRASWPAVGVVPGWVVIVDPHFEFGDADVELTRVSIGTRVLRLSAIERDGFSHATLWCDGAKAWEVSFEAETDDRPLTAGPVPVDVDELAVSMSPAMHYRAALVAVEKVLGFSPASVFLPGDRGLAQLVYPRPAGVAASVDRERNDAD
jgi:hypothetical protein